MSHRKQAAFHALKANQARALAQRHYKLKNKAEASLQHYRDFGRKQPMVLFTLLYILILFVDTCISYPLIRPIADRMLQGMVLFGFFFYGGLLLGLSTIASSNLFKAKREQVDLQVSLELVHNPHEGELSVRNRVLDDAASHRRQGIFWTAILLLVLLAFGLFRTYLVNGHQLKFSNGADYVWLILPPVLGLLLVYLGQYKSLLFEKIRLGRFVKRSDVKIDSYRNQAGSEKDLVSESIRKADDTGEPNIIDKETEECVDYYRNHTSTGFEFVSSDKFYDLRLNVFYKGRKQAGIPISAITADHQTLKVNTDSTGCAILQWKGESDWVFNLSVFDMPVRGEKFAAGTQIDIELQLLLHQQGYDQGDFEKRLSGLNTDGEDPMLLV